MYILPFFVGAALAASNSWCSTESASPGALAAVRSLQAAEKSGVDVQHRREAKINIPVYMTAVVNSTNAASMLTHAVLRKQFDVLADRFAPYDITFTLKNTTRLVDDDASRGFDYYDFTSFKARNRRGGYTTLNLYFVSNTDDAAWGSASCTVPADLPGGPGFLAMLDGCTLCAYTAPGGVDKGKTYKGEIAVHEVGHWLSLMHTFEGLSCDGPGDYIDDTPQESVHTLNVCPVGRDSCPGKPGLDPIRNYMDSTGEGCWTGFTPMQKTRMHNAYWTLRHPYEDV